MYSFQKALNALNQLSTPQNDIASSDAEYIMRDAVMFFHHSIETLFKDILHDKCPVLDARDIQLNINRRYDKQMGKPIEKGNLEYTSTFLETVKRMTVICSLQMDEYLYEKFERLNEIRNACTHNEMDLMCVHAEKLVLELFPVVVWILERNLLDPKRELFEQYMTTIQGSHAKWRIETLLSLYRLGADAMKNDRQNKLLLSLIGGRTPCLENINETVFHEWLENQFCWTMLQVGENDWEEYRTAIKKTSDVEKAFKNFAKRFLKDTFTILSESSDDFSNLSVENCLYVLISLQEIQPIISLEAWIHHKNRFEDARRAIKMENGQNLDEIHKKVSAWKK